MIPYFSIFYRYVYQVLFIVKTILSVIVKNNLPDSLSIYLCLHSSLFGAKFLVPPQNLVKENIEVSKLICSLICF